jgi:hypothetical protein
MTKPEQPQPERAADQKESEALSLDKETLKDLDAPESEQGDPKGGWFPESLLCKTFNCLTEPCTIRR